VEPLSEVASPRDCSRVFAMGPATIGLWYPSYQGSQSDLAIAGVGFVGEGFG
jgi:hypothetical protein